jgi:hypothetical protein
MQELIKYWNDIVFAKWSSKEGEEDLTNHLRDLDAVMDALDIESGDEYDQDDVDRNDYDNGNTYDDNYNNYDNININYDNSHGDGGAVALPSGLVGPGVIGHPDAGTAVVCFASPLLTRSSRSKLAKNPPSILKALVANKMKAGTTKGKGKKKAT